MSIVGHDFWGVVANNKESDIMATESSFERYRIVGVSESWATPL